MAKAFLCLWLLAAAVMGAAPAFAACVPVNGLTFEREPDCKVSAAVARATPAPVAPAAVAPVAAPARQEASAPAQEKVQRPAPAPAPAREVVARTPSAPLYRVKPGLSDGFLAMRSGPGTHYSMVVRIPSGSDGVSVAECPRSRDASRGWCRASWKGKTGWVFNRYITQQN